MSEHDEEFTRLLAESSLGTPGARQLRDRTSADQARFVRQINKLRQQIDDAPAVAQRNAAILELAQLFTDLGWDAHAGQVREQLRAVAPGAEATAHAQPASGKVSMEGPPTVPSPEPDAAGLVADDWTASSANTQDHADAPSDHVHPAGTRPAVVLWDQPAHSPTTVTRPFAVTRGRAEPRWDLALETLLVAGQSEVQQSRFAGHDKYRIAALCADRPQSLAEIAARTRLPVGAARALVSDMLAEDLLTRHNGPEAISRESRTTVIDKVLSGLRHGSKSETGPNQSLAAAKVVIAGGNGVGKTSLITAVSGSTPLTAEAVVNAAGVAIGNDPAAAAGKETTTVALDFGRMTVADDLILYLFSSPTRATSWFMWDEVIRDAVGAVALIDTRRLTDAFALLDYLENRQVPYLVAVNEFDGAPRYQLDEIREALAIEPHVPLITCNARDHTSATRTVTNVVEHAASTLRTLDTAAANQP
jgi:signal recognition particle receptor subunit beta